MTRRSAIALLPVTLIYLAPPPDGSDANSGASVAQAVASLQHALDLASAAPHGTEVRIIAEPKVFPPATASIESFIAAPIRIIGTWWPNAIAGQKPAFSCTADQSMVLEVRGDEPALYTGVSLEGVKIGNCRNGVEFRGNYGDPQRFVWGNELVDVDFANIGNAASGGGDGYEAVGIFNNWGFVAYDTTFDGVKNTPAGASDIHAWYIGHHSRNTELAGATYKGISGAAIATRNDVVNTLAWNQSFGADVASPKIIDWYCSQSVEACPALDGSTAPECPSWGTYVESATGIAPSDIRIYDGSTGVPSDQYLNLGRWGYPQGCLVPQRLAVGSLAP